MKHMPLKYYGIFKHSFPRVFYNFAFSRKIMGISYELLELHSVKKCIVRNPERINGGIIIKNISFVEQYTFICTICYTDRRDG